MKATGVQAPDGRARDDVSDAQVRAALKKHDGVAAKAAEELGVSGSTIAPQGEADRSCRQEARRPYRRGRYNLRNSLRSP